MNIHHSHTLTRDGHNGLCDPWQRCMACNGTDRPGDGRLAAECQAQDTALAALRALAAGDNTVAKRAAARIEELEAKLSEMREAARGARNALRDAEHVIEFVVRMATKANLPAAAADAAIAKHPAILAKTGAGNG